MKTVIVGAGINGLAVGIQRLYKGDDVTIVAEYVSPFTTSDIAAAFAYQYHVSVEPRELGDTWFGETYREYQRQATNPYSGINFAPCTILFESPEQTPSWSKLVDNFHRIQPTGLLKRYEDGFTFETAIVEMPIYLSFLRARFYKLGGHLVMKRVDSLDDTVFADADVIVNCAGLGARELFNDPQLFPIRGQILLLERSRDLAPFVILAEGPNLGIRYIVVRSTTVVIGGTAEDGVDDITVNPQQAREILDNAIELVPELAHARVLGAKVGLRPGRNQVRVDQERLASGQVVVHSCGQGGAGVTLAWGCAAHVSALIDGLGTGLSVDTAAD